MSNNSDQKVTSQLKSQPKQSDGLEIFQPFIDQTSDKVSDAVAQRIVILTVEKTFNKLGNFIPDTEHIWKAYEGKFQPLSGSPEPKAIAGN
jgi:hypothetical protein